MILILNNLLLNLIRRQNYPQLYVLSTHLLKVIFSANTHTKAISFSKSGPDKNQEPGTPSQSSTCVARTQVLGPFSTAFANLCKKTDQKQCNQDLNQYNDMECQCHMEQLNSLCHKQPKANIFKIT